MSNEPPAKVLKLDSEELQDDSNDVEMMEIENSSSSSSEMIDKPALDICNHELFQIEKRHVAEIKSFPDLANYVTRCDLTVIKFTSECNLEDVVKNFSVISATLFPNVFIFVFEYENLKLGGPDVSHVESLIKNLFIADSFTIRPLILQFTSKSENLSKFYYKKSKSNKFLVIGNENGNIVNFPSFFWKFMNGEIKIIDEDLLVNVFTLQKQESAIIIRFLNIFKLPESILWNLKFECVKSGCKSQFLAAFGGSFEDNVIHQNSEMQNTLNRTFLLQNNHLDTEVSILLLAVENSNHEIIEYLTTNYSHLIHQLPFDHQVKISRTALNRLQFDTLCELIEECDFPFPEQSTNKYIMSSRLIKLVENRCEFFTAIQFGNLKTINTFIEYNPNLKIVYNIDNKSALKQSIDSDKIDIYYKLKNCGFLPAFGEDFENFLTVPQREKFAEISVQNALENTAVLQLTERSFIHNCKQISKEMKNYYRQQIQSWYEEINKSKFGFELINAIAQCKDLKLIFDFESEYIHNMDMSPRDEAIGKVYPHRNWIFIGAKNEQDNERQQEIKGTIAHEFSHYILNVIFDNNLKPYSKKSKKVTELFSKIVSVYFHWFHSAFSNGGIEEDDGCDSIISSVYKKYSTDKHHQELIVRVPEILTYFDGDDEKIKQVSNRYKLLFIFYKIFVSSALKRFNLEDRECVRMFNNIAGVLQKVWNMKYDMKDWKDLSSYLNRSIIIASNNPRLLLRNICYCLFKENHLLYNSKAIFLAPKCLENETILSKLDEILAKERNVDCIEENSEELLTQFEAEFALESALDVSMKDVNDPNQISTNSMDMSRSLEENSTNFKNLNHQNIELSSSINSKINIIVDCSKESGICLNKFANLFSRTTANFIFVIPNENENENLDKILRDKIGVPERINKDYTWNDLTTESQELLLQSEISLQNGSKIPLKNLKVGDFTNQQGDLATTNGNVNLVQHPENFQSIIDSRLLNLLMDNSSQIQINKNSNKEFKSDDFFEAVFQSRNFIKKSPKEIERTFSIDYYENLKESSRKFKNIEIDFENEKVKLLEVIEVSESLSFKNQLDEAKTQKYILISDTAGTGKSWMLKNIANVLQKEHSDRWITYVDLNQFIDDFSSHRGEFNFTNFMTDKIIKPKEIFEKKIFQQLYKYGKVSVFFDGFDEICSECTEPVIKLLESFEHNNENQLWITTRDYYEVDIQKKLNIDVVYNLDEFTEEYGIKLISLSWTLKDLKRKNIKIEVNKLEDILRNNSLMLENYKQKARNLINKIPKLKTRKIGYPLFFKIVSEIYDGQLNEEIVLSLYNTYRKYTFKQCQIWSTKKGKIRSEESIKIQMNGVNFVLVHQFHAMKNLFPTATNFCGLTKEKTGWTEIQIYNFGLINKNVFIHETFCEFYAAEFVLRLLGNGDWETFDDFFYFFVILLTKKKFDVVRMFINEGWNENSISSKMEGKIQNFANKFGQIFNKDLNFSIIYSENLENLAAFLINIFEYFAYDKVQYLLFSNINFIINMTQNSELYLKFQSFYVEKLEIDDLKKLITNKQVINEIIDSPLNHKVIEDLVDKINDKISENFIKQALVTEVWRENLLTVMVASKHFTAKKIQTLCLIIQKYLGIDKLISMFRSDVDNFKTNIMHKIMFTKNKEILRTVWNTFKDITSLTDKPLCKLLPQLQRNKRRTPLHDATFSNEMEFFETLWELLLNTFENREELKKFLLQKDIKDNSFIHMLVSFQNADIIRYSFNILKNNLNSPQYKEIIFSKGFEGRNLLQKSADMSLDISVYQVLWNIVHEACDSSDEFIQIVLEEDESSNNVLFMAVNFPTSNVFNLMIEELENLTDREKIKEILRSKNGYEQNLFHKSLRFNLSLDMHIGLWKIIGNKFEPDEIRSFIMEQEQYNCNIMHYAVTYSSFQIAIYTLEKIRFHLSNEQFKEYLGITGFRGYSLFESAQQNKKIPIMSRWIGKMAETFY